MTSAIDATKPVAGSPTTQSVRDNFATARSEITALQAAGPYLPLVGGTINPGPLVVNANTAAFANPQAGAMIRSQPVDAGQNTIQMNAFGAGSTNHILGYAASGTATTPAAVNMGPIINIEARGYDGTGWSGQQAAVGLSQITSPWTAADHSTKINFNTTPVGSTAVANVAVIAAGLTLGAPTGGDKGVGTLNATGVYANNVLLTSDASVKRDIEPLPDDCLALVGAIEPKRFRFIEPDPLPPNPDIEGAGPTPAGPPGWFDKTRWGFVAQDVEAAMHGHDFDGVEAGPDGIRSLDYNSMIACLWKAVRELSDRLAALEAGR